MSLCHLSFLESKAPSALEVKMGRGGQDEPAGKSEITLVTRAKNWPSEVKKINIKSRNSGKL